ncbi:MAG: glycosyltransferase family A protein, partial [Ferruginibacter sp.]
MATAIESVLSQDFKTFELIFVNDGSTDNSLMIAESFSKNDARIRLFSRPNGGLNSARNYGAKRAADNSEALLFFDADDILEKNMIASLYHELKSGSNVGAAYCNYKCMDTNGIKLKKENNSRRLIPTKFWFKDLPITEKTT